MSNNQSQAIYAGAALAVVATVVETAQALVRMTAAAHARTRRDLQRRRAARQLRTLNDHLLRDIGLQRHDIDAHLRG